MKQISLATTGFELATERTHKKMYVDEINLVVPRTELVVLIQPFAPSVCCGNSVAYLFASAVPFAGAQKARMSELRDFIIQLTDEQHFTQQVQKTPAVHDYYAPNKRQTVAGLAHFLHERIVERQ